MAGPDAPRPSASPPCSAGDAEPGYMWAASPTRGALLERARDMVPALRERAERAEAERRMPDETDRAFHDAGFYRIFRPLRHGGLEMDIGLLWELCAEIGRGCGSSAWILGNIAGHDTLNGMRDPRCQDEIWGGPGNGLVCSCFPSADAAVRRVEGGVAFAGTWSFASGVDQADWVDFNLFVPRADGPPEHVVALVPKSECRVIDDWFVTGLAATGSRSVAVRDCFVPDYRTIATAACRGGPTPGSAVNPGPLYKIPIWATGGKMFVGPLIGLARGALELTMDDLAGRTGASGADIKAQPTVQLRIAEADAEIAAAMALTARDSAAIMDFAGRGEAPPLTERVRWRRDYAYSAKLCLQAVERLYALAGARRLAATHPFQRAWRDAHACAAQLNLNWDMQAVNFGRVAFGFPSADPRV